MINTFSPQFHKILNQIPMKKEKLDCKSAKKILITSVLGQEGIFPKRENDHKAFYFSFLRDEKTPSLKVDKQLNLWYDFGADKGGTVLDLVMTLKKISLLEALEYLNFNQNYFSFHQQANTSVSNKSSMKITSVAPITKEALLKYLEERKIPRYLYQKFCREVHYLNGFKNYYAIGFKNNSEGWELRNRFFKNAYSPKDITTIYNENDTVLIFEGFMDFLSHRVIFPDQFNCDFIISNSTAMIKKLGNKLANYDLVELWLDNDQTGKSASEFIKSIHHNVKDMCSFYTGCKDLNEWLVKH